MQARGFTLIELLVVLALMATLATLAMPMVEIAVQRERERELKASLAEIRKALDAYRDARVNGALPLSPGESPYPPSLEALTRAYQDARPGSRGAPLRFLRRIPRDPFADPTLPAQRSWGLRSYASSADDPQPGADVYDVYSTVARLGLNGVPLRKW